MNKLAKERIIERYLRHYKTYKVGIKNLQMQLDYLMPSLVSSFTYDGSHPIFFIANDTEKVAMDRIESRRAIDLREEIEQLMIIIESIDNGFNQLQDKEKEFVDLRYFNKKEIWEVKQLMKYAEEKSLYKIRRRALDSLLISLNNLIYL
jgi:hypothetical protein